MKVDAKFLSTRGAYKRLLRGEIDPAPDYQRGRVWSRRKQALLIDSILRGYDLPKLFVRDVGAAEILSFR
jgi:uncharacterized protein with ParB-like and HNH nuclease domain